MDKRKPPYEKAKQRRKTMKLFNLIAGPLLFGIGLLSIVVLFMNPIMLDSTKWIISIIGVASLIVGSTCLHSSKVI